VAPTAVYRLVAVSRGNIKGPHVVPRPRRRVEAKTIEIDSNRLNALITQGPAQLPATVQAATAQMPAMIEAPAPAIEPQRRLAHTIQLRTTSGGAEHPTSVGLADQRGESPLPPPPVPIAEGSGARTPVPPPVEQTPEMIAALEVEVLEITPDEPIEVEEVERHSRSFVALVVAALVFVAIGVIALAI
jgi:hypothetical protein